MASLFNEDNDPNAELLQALGRAFSPSDFQDDKYTLGPGDTFQNERGSFNKLQANPGVDNSIAQNLIKLREFNQREQENQMREKLQRFQNSAMGAHYSGDSRGEAQAMAMAAQLMPSIQGFDTRDTQRQEITSRESMAEALNRLNEKLGMGKLELGGKELDQNRSIEEMRNSTNRRGQDTQRSIAESGDQTQRDIQGMRNASASEGYGSTEKVAGMQLASREKEGELDRQIKRELSQYASEQEINMLKLKLAAGADLSEKEAKLKQTAQAIAARLSQDPNDSRANKLIDKTLKEAGPSMLDRVGDIAKSPIEQLLQYLGG